MTWRAENGKTFIPAVDYTNQNLNRREIGCVGVGSIVRKISDE